MPNANIPIVPLAALGFVVFAFINFLKFLFARDWNSAITQLIVWVAGLGAVFIFSAAPAVSHGIIMLGKPLDMLDAGSKIVLGLMAASTFGTGFNELKKALDTTDTANTPHLLPSLSRHAYRTDAVVDAHTEPVHSAVKRPRARRTT